MILTYSNQMATTVKIFNSALFPCLVAVVFVFVQVVTEEVGIDSQSVNVSETTNHTKDVENVTLSSQHQHKLQHQHQHHPHHQNPIEYDCYHDHGLVHYDAVRWEPSHPRPTLRHHSHHHHHPKPRRQAVHHYSPKPSHRARYPPQSYETTEHYRPQYRLIVDPSIRRTTRTLVNELMEGVSSTFRKILHKSPTITPVRLINRDRIRSSASKLMAKAPSVAIRRSMEGSPSNVNYAVTEASNQTTATQGGISASGKINYEVGGKRLRDDIIGKVGHLQTIFTTALEVGRERRDRLARRLLDQAHNRLERAKERADKILSEPSNQELAVKTLYSINNGINGLSTFLQAVSHRITSVISDPNDPLHGSLTREVISTDSNAANNQTAETINPR